MEYRIKGSRMEQAENFFELSIAGQFGGQPVAIEPDETTDGVPLYYCYLNGTAISQLRHEPGGKWLQIWGDLSPAAVQQVGEAIADYAG